MHVLMVIERYAPLWGGSELQLELLTSHLLQKGIVCHVITRRWFSTLKKVDTHAGSLVYRVGIPGTHQLSTFLYCCGLVWFIISQRKKYALIHTHGALALGAVVSIASLVNKKPVVVKIATAGKVKQLARTIGGRFVIRAAKVASAFVALSDQIEHELVDSGFNKTVLFRIPNGVDVELYKPVEDSLKLKTRFSLHLPKQGTMVLAAGRLVWRKGFDILLPAWQKVESENDSSFLVIVGSGANQKDSCEAHLHDLSIRLQVKRVYFRPEVSSVQNYLAAADIFAFPSRIEGMPNILLEAMASGLAVVASRIGGVVDIITNNQTGILVDAEKTEEWVIRLQQLIKNRSMQKQCAKAARSHILLHHSVTSVSESYFKLYTELFIK